MKERPILFSGEMVRAILEGRKTQTRRVIKPQPDSARNSVFVKSGFETKHGYEIKCPYGQPGDRLWVRETWGLWDTDPKDGPERAKIFYRATDENRRDLRYQRWRPSIHMPRWASRINLEITNIRIERVQDITEEDAKAEGLFL